MTWTIERREDRRGRMRDFLVCGGCDKAILAWDDTPETAAPCTTCGEPESLIDELCRLEADRGANLAAEAADERALDAAI